ncbi:MAG: dihydroorotase [Bacteroidetes bacterium]|nr:dihydroorotase [Bacteroidota bacterium]
MNYLLKRGRLIDPLSNTDKITDIFISNGVIEKIGENISISVAHEEINLENKIIAPGFIDIHAHLREPGFEHKETIETGILSAIYGGFTAICCMPNTNPAIDSKEVAQKIIAKSNSTNYGIVDVYPIAAATKNREGKILNNFDDLKKSGCVAITDDGAPIWDDNLMELVLLESKKLNLPIIQHAEIPELANNGVMNYGKKSIELGVNGIPNISEYKMVLRDINLSEKTNGIYHVAHISAKESIELVRRAKEKKLKVSCEVTPHHFTLTDEIVSRENTNTKMNPPLRTKEDLDAIIEGLIDNTIEIIATDHAPHTDIEKKQNFETAPFGIVGFETAIGLTFTNLVEKGMLSVKNVIEKLSTNPRKLINKNIKIEVGENACFTFIDPKIKWKVDSLLFKSKSKNTPFNNFILTGKSVGIFNNGNLFMTIV